MSDANPGRRRETRSPARAERSRMNPTAVARTRGDGDAVDGHDIASVAPSTARAFDSSRMYPAISDGEIVHPAQGKITGVQHQRLGQRNIERAKSRHTV